MALKDRFLNLPVAVNNYYGDPTLQWQNTLSKIERLIKDNHKGVIAILTRGLVTKEMAKELKSLSYPKLVVIPPISHLTHKEIQNHEDRYRTIENLIEQDIKVLPNLRPIIKGQNDHMIDYMFMRLSQIGVKNVICSGIRGNDEILLKAGVTEEELHNYCLRVKIIPKPLGDKLKEASEKYRIYVAKRVSCGVAVTFNTISHNPYWKSPQLAGCYTCKLKDQCFDKMIVKQNIDEELTNFLDGLGYQYERMETYSHCQTLPEKRLECLSCCTACYVHGNNTIKIHNTPISLGTLSFLRFLFVGFTFTFEGIRDTGAKDTAVVYIPDADENYKKHPAHAINSWYVLANQMDKCYNCNYCIVHAYNPDQKEHGIFPMDMYNYIEDLLSVKA